MTLNKLDSRIDLDQRVRGTYHARPDRARDRQNGSAG